MSFSSNIEARRLRSLAKLFKDIATLISINLNYTFDYTQHTSSKGRQRTRNNRKKVGRKEWKPTGKILKENIIASVTAMEVESSPSAQNVQIPPFSSSPLKDGPSLVNPIVEENILQANKKTKVTTNMPVTTSSSTEKKETESKHNEKEKSQVKDTTPIKEHSLEDQQEIQQFESQQQRRRKKRNKDNSLKDTSQKDMESTTVEVDTDTSSSKQKFQLWLANNKSRETWLHKVEALQQHPKYWRNMTPTSSEGFLELNKRLAMYKHKQPVEFCMWSWLTDNNVSLNEEEFYDLLLRSVSSGEPIYTFYNLIRNLWPDLPKDAWKEKFYWASGCHDPRYPYP
jgi:hypothetical protein